MVRFFFQAEDGIRDRLVTGVQTCALPILPLRGIKVKVKYHGGDEQESVEPQIRIEHTVKPLQLVPLLPHSGHESKRRGYNWGMKAKKEYHSSGGSPYLPISIIILLCFVTRSEEHTSELQSQAYLVCRLLLEK
mgnify:CR=1 FL=1